MEYVDNESMMFDIHGNKSAHLRKCFFKGKSRGSVIKTKINLDYDNDNPSFKVLV